MHSMSRQSKEFARELDVCLDDEDELQISDVRKCRRHVKKQGLEQLESKWLQKPLHGQYAIRCRGADVDQTDTHQWLKSSGLKAETEALLLAAQDQSLLTRNVQANIFRNGADPKCRFCNLQTETIDHIVSGCPVLAPTEYRDRHDKVGKYLHWKICRHYQIATADRWYEHQPDPVSEGKDVTVLWDFTIHTDRTIKANRPDIIIKDHKQKKCLLIDMSIPSDANISSKEFEKIAKYKDLQIEIQKMWHLRVETVPVIVGALGMIKKAQKLINKIPGDPYPAEVQKIALLGTARILRGALS